MFDIDTFKEIRRNHDIIIYIEFVISEVHRKLISGMFDCQNT